MRARMRLLSETLHSAARASASFNSRTVVVPLIGVTGNGRSEVSPSEGAFSSVHCAVAVTQKGSTLIGPAAGVVALGCAAAASAAEISLSEEPFLSTPTSRSGRVSTTSYGSAFLSWPAMSSFGSLRLPRRNARTSTAIASGSSSSTAAARSRKTPIGLRLWMNTPCLNFFEPGTLTFTSMVSACSVAASLTASTAASTVPAVTVPPPAAPAATKSASRATTRTSPCMTLEPRSSPKSGQSRSRVPFSSDILTTSSVLLEASSPAGANSTLPFAEHNTPPPATARSDSPVAAAAAASTN
mmetsp:Transcript_24584/g.85486  ORF Transcript_24584/g.85486 Transcript_24584/m.85486 type:complete len:299 (+) Transcript_24584:110-1006(+)